MKFRTQFSDYKGHPGTKMDPSSQTVPDMNLSLRQLLDNYSRGIPTGAAFREGEYFEDEVIPQFDDLVDLQMARENLENRKNDLEASLKAKREAGGPDPLHIKESPLANVPVSVEGKSEPARQPQNE